MGRLHPQSMMDLMKPPTQAIMGVIKPPTKVIFNMVNPVNIAERLNPHTQSVMRLLRPIMKPKRPVNWIKKQLTWRNLQAPLSAVAAVVLGGLCAVMSQFSTSVHLSPASVISITTIVMEFGSTERFYIRSALRILGTVCGAFAGFGFGVIGIYIGDDTTGTNLVALQSYRLCIVAVGALITFIGMKVFDQTSYAFMMFGVTMFSVLYTFTWVSALTAMLSALAGVVVSIFTILMFQFPKADVILANTHKKAVENLFTLVRFAIESDPRCLDDFDECAASVREALASTSASFEVYSQWRRWTKRTVIHKFDSLSSATRPLFYLSFSMYWSLVESPSAHACGGQFFFCNHPGQYDKYFRATRMGLEGSVMSIQSCLSKILVKDPKDHCPPQQLMDMVVSLHLWSGCVRNIQILKEQYISHREECFSSFGQHWSVCDYLHQLISLTLAITAYVHAIAEVFMPDMAEHIYPMLEDICENLSQLRNEGSWRLDHFNQFVNPSRPASSYSHANPSRGTSGFSPGAGAFDYTVNSFTIHSNNSRVLRGLDNDADVEHSDDPISPDAAGSETYPGSFSRYGMNRGRGVDEESDAQEITPRRVLSP